MNLFNELAGFERSAPGLEHRVWRRLPALLLWGTLLPLGLALLNHALAPQASGSGAADSALLLWDYTMFGAVLLHWTLLLTLALGCFIVRVMKGPAYVADACPLPSERGLGHRGSLQTRHNTRPLENPDAASLAAQTPQGGWRSARGCKKASADRLLTLAPRTRPALCGDA
jgi:hypothetical protein